MPPTLGGQKCYGSLRIALAAEILVCYLLVYDSKRDPLLFVRLQEVSHDSSRTVVKRPPKELAETVARNRRSGLCFIAHFIVARLFAIFGYSPLSLSLSPRYRRTSVKKSRQLIIAAAEPLSCLRLRKLTLSPLKGQFARIEGEVSFARVDLFTSDGVVWSTSTTDSSGPTLFFLYAGRIETAPLELERLIARALLLASSPPTAAAASHYTTRFAPRRCITKRTGVYNDRLPMRISGRVLLLRPALCLRSMYKLTRNN